MDATHRLAAVFTVLTLLAMPALSSLAAAPIGTPASTPIAAPLDLATMLLIPSDVQRPHAMLWSGARYFPDAYSHRRAGALEAAGDLGGFEVWLGPPTADRAYLVGATLDEFRDAAGAAAGYRINQGSGGAPVTGVAVIGDESALFRWTDTDPYDPRRPDHGLILVFRLGRLVASVSVDDYTGAQPHAAEAIALGQVMAARITKVLAGDPTEPGLSNRAVRFDVPIGASFQDGYYRLNGQDRVGWEGNLPTGQPTFAQTFPGATTVMLVGQDASTDQGAPWARVRLVQFPTTKAAAGWVDGVVAIAEQGPSGWHQVKPVTLAGPFGDQTRAMTYQYPAASGAPGTTVYGTAIITRYGALAVSVRIEAYRPVPVTLVQSLMAAQQRCLKLTGTCPRVTPSPALLDLTVTSADRSTRHQAIDRPSVTTPAWRPAHITDSSRTAARRCPRAAKANGPRRYNGRTRVRTVSEARGVGERAGAVS